MTVLVPDESVSSTRGARKVLVTEGALGQGRSAVATVRALAAAGYIPVVTTTGGRGPAAASRHCTATVEVPQVASPAFAEAVRAELRTGRYVGALPVSDAAVVALGLDPLGLLDKAALEHRARTAGIEGVPGRVFASRAALLRSSADLEYPLIVKASSPSAMGTRLPATRIDAPHDLDRLPPIQGDILVQPRLAKPMSAVAGVVWRGRLVTAVHQRYQRTWPVDCGTASYAVSVEPDRSLEDRLVRLLAGFTGIFQAQFLGTHLIDLNPRVYGSLPLAVAAGVNLPVVLCDLVRGVDVPERRGRAGVHYRWVEGDVRNLWWARRRDQMGWQQVLGALRPRSGTAHSTASWRDPGPLLNRLMRVASRVAR